MNKFTIELIKRYMDELAPYSTRGRVYYGMMQAQEFLDDVEMFEKIGFKDKWMEQQARRVINHLQNLQNFCYSTYVLGESHNKSKLKLEYGSTK